MVSLASIESPIALAAYTVAEFCAAHRISRSKLYELWQEGRGPRKMRVDSRVLISVESATEWRRGREAASASEAAL